MSKPAMLADHLDQQTDAILAVWRTAVKRVGDVQDADRLTYAEFMDHVPDLLDRLADRLRGNCADVTREGRNHGTVRLRQGYDIAEVVKEFAHLRTVLARSTADFAREHGWDITRLESAHEVVNDVLDEATAESVRQFQEGSRAQTDQALAEVKRRQRSIEDAWIATKLERAKLRTILGSLPVAVWVVGPDGTMIGINDEAVRLQGLDSKDALLRINVKNLGPEHRVFRLDGSVFPNDELPIVRALGGETVTQEEVLWISQGESKTVSINAAPLTDAKGTILGAVSVMQDVTRRQQMEGQLRQERDLSRTITDTLGEGLLTFDSQGLVTFANPAALEALGWPAEELLGRDVHTAIPRLRLDGTPYTAEECPLLSVLRTERAAQGDEVFIRKDGSRFVGAFTASLIQSSGRISGVVVAFRDVTERKRLEAQLAASEARFRSIAEKTPVMIWRADVNGLCDYVNQTWIDFRGRAPETDDEMGEGWAEGIHPDDRPRCLSLYRDAFVRREPFELTYRLLRHDGQYRWISDRGTPYSDADQTFLGYLGSCLDITERIELETLLVQQRFLAEEASRHKTRLVSALSHDARTPLNAVVLAAQLLEIHFDGGLDDEVRTCLHTIRHSVRNVLDLLGDLLNLSKIDAGGLPAEVSQFPLEPVLTECLASIEPQARMKGLELRYEPGPLADKIAETDRSKLKQILSNLLSNALRYTERGHIHLYAEQTPDQLHIAVADTGVGIDPSDQERIFDEFAVLDHSTRAEGGTGLGLAICRRLASLLKGEIRLTSAPGLGSTFTLILPSSVLTATPPAQGGKDAFESPSSDLGAIVVAEDHVDSRQTLAKVLRRMGYRVLEASNGRDVLALVAQERVLGVLMDVNMPVMDGIEATLALRADPRFAALPIFALTGDVTVVNQHRIGEAGVNGYLEKPVTWDALKQALGTLADQTSD